MTGKNAARYLILVMLLLAMAPVAGCGGGGGVTIEVAPLSEGRWGHTATLLEDGRVLVVGGQQTETPALATAEIYDPSSKAWSSAGVMAEAHGEGHTATLLKDGRVLVVGGSSTVEVYDPSAGTWSSTGGMAKGRLWQTATLLGDGRVLVAGGQDPTLTRVQEYDSAEV